MTGFADNVYSGLLAPSSAQASYTPVRLSRTFRFAASGAAAQTQNFVLPQGCQNLDAKLYIIANGSAATTDKITVSAGGVNYITFTGIGSATGILRQTTTSLGTMTVIASAMANLSTTAEVTAAVTLAAVDTASDYQVEVMFTRVRVDPLGNT